MDIGPQCWLSYRIRTRESEERVQITERGMTLTLTLVTVTMVTVNSPQAHCTDCQFAPYQFAPKPWSIRPTLHILIAL
jgi:hypothetical protein